MELARGRDGWRLIPIEGGSRVLDRAKELRDSYAEEIETQGRGIMGTFQGFDYSASSGGRDSSGGEV